MASYIASFLQRQGDDCGGNFELPNSRMWGCSRVRETSWRKTHDASVVTRGSSTEIGHVVVVVVGTMVFWMARSLLFEM